MIKEKEEEYVNATSANGRRMIEENSGVATGQRVNISTSISETTKR